MSASSANEQEDFKPRILIGVLWIAFVIFSVFIAPGSIFTSTELKKMLRFKSSEVNKIFTYIFGLVGLVAWNYWALLNAGAARQRKYLPANPFLLVGLFLGLLGSGPYLALRKPAPGVTSKEVRERGFLGRMLESRWFNIFTLCRGILAYYGLFTLFFSSAWAPALAELSHLFKIDRVVVVATVDLILLSAVLWGPLKEDMARRGWFRNGNDRKSVLTALAIMAVPALGCSFYLANRPSLEAVEAGQGRMGQA